MVKNKKFQRNEYPSLIKYMGSKSKIMDFVLEGINKVHKGGTIYDLFAGSASLAGAIGQQCAVHSNDIQSYTQVLADTYNNAYKTKTTPSSSEILSEADAIILENGDLLKLDITYSKNLTLKEFQKIENLQKSLINADFTNDWHLFVKNYSGTWWSYEQCLWIDAIRQVSERHKKDPCYSVIMASLMFSMAYASQGTGHYAQYRDAKTTSSLKDILIYRRRSIVDYFKRKYDEIISSLPIPPPHLEHKTTQLDFRDCMGELNEGTVYADPPYCFVHYSRFYHALETLVLYDYPEIQVIGDKIVKGRYRENRHQSPFCIKTKVKQAFVDMISGVERSGANLVLSYSNTGMIGIDDLMSIAGDILTDKKIEILTTDHLHMTLGRKNDRQREVQECLILAY